MGRQCFWDVWVFERPGFRNIRFLGRPGFGAFGFLNRSDFSVYNFAMLICWDILVFETSAFMKRLRSLDVWVLRCPKLLGIAKSFETYIFLKIRILGKQSFRKVRVFRESRFGTSMFFRHSGFWDVLVVDFFEFLEHPIFGSAAWSRKLTTIRMLQLASRLGNINVSALRFSLCRDTSPLCLRGLAPEPSRTASR